MKDGLTNAVKSILFWFAISVLLYGSFLVASIFVVDSSSNGAALPLLGEAKSLAANVVASFLLYYLVGYLPSQRHRRMLRDSCKRMYRAIKKEILFEILSGSWQGGRRDIELTIDLRDKLMAPLEFRKMFEHGSEADEGFYAFRNYIQSNEEAFRLIVSKFKSVARQIEFILDNLEIEDQKKFEKLRWLEWSLLSLDNLHANYDDEKVLDRMIWEIFGGWSIIDGYRDYDPIEKAIDEI